MGAGVMSEADDLARRVAELEARAAITDLVYRYAEHIHSGRAHDNVALFADDAVFELRHADPHRPGETILRQRLVGAGAIAGSLADTAGETARVWPMIHNLRIELNGDGDHASSSCIMMTAMWPTGSQFVGEYRDRYRRVAGAWRFAARTYVLFGDTTGAYAAEAHQEFLTVKR